MNKGSYSIIPAFLKKIVGPYRRNMWLKSVQESDLTQEVINYNPAPLSPRQSASGRTIKWEILWEYEIEMTDDDE